MSRKICEDSEVGDHKAVLMKWEQISSSPNILQGAALEAVVEAMVILNPEKLTEMAHYLGTHQDKDMARTMQSLVSSILKVGCPDVAQDFIEMLDSKCKSFEASKLRLLVLGSLASRGAVAKTQELLKSQDGNEAHNVAVRGFLEGGHKEIALQHTKEMLGTHQLHVSTTAALLAACDQESREFVQTTADGFLSLLAIELGFLEVSQLFKFQLCRT